MNKKNFALSVIFLLFISCIIPLNVLAQEPTLSMSPDSIQVNDIDETITVDLMINDVQNLWGWTSAITWNPEFLTFVGTVTEGDFLSNQGSTFFQASEPESGVIREISCLFLLTTSASGSGVLTRLQFKVLKPCIETPISVENVTLLSPELSSDPQELHQAIKKMMNPVPLAYITCLGDSGLIAQAGNSQIVNEGTLVIFNGSKSLSSSDDVQYSWTFNDNGEKSVTGKIANYTFQTPGIYEVTLTVSNSEGLESTDSITIEVLDITPPVAVIVLKSSTGEEIDPNKVALNQKIQLDATLSYDPEGGYVSECTWNLGDGSPIIHGIFPVQKDASLVRMENLTIDHQYSEMGEYTVTLTVFDEVSNLTGTTSMVIKVGDIVEDDASQSLSLPPYIIAIVIGVTIVTICGSILWLNGIEIRKPKTFES